MSISLDKTGIVIKKIGESTDVWSQDGTVLGYTNVAYQHVHQSAKCYPTLANGVVIAGGVGSWVLGNFVEIVPSNVIIFPYDIHYIVIENASANDVYEIVLYSGTLGNELEIGRVRTKRDSAVAGAPNVPIQIPPQAPNTRISAKVASSTGGDSVTVSLYYHQYM
jgi:hypothetical protein